MALRCSCAAAALGAALALASPVGAATYQVGPSRALHDLHDVVDRLAPGDVVELDGDHTYASGDLTVARSGARGAPITIRGVRVAGRRPVLSGGDYTLLVVGDHVVVEGVEITGATTACVYVGADDLTLRDAAIHGCQHHGVLASDSGSGSQSYELVELHDNGDAETRHQMYVTTDESLHPGSVVRVQHCFFHDGRGGNNLKSRAERNEIAFNWIEGAAYHELDLIGPDAPEALAREDSDVVGNVIVKSAASPWFAARLGGDGTGQTWGRYRFANNTFVLGSGQQKAAIFLQDGIESVELTNNVFYAGGAAIPALRDPAAVWSSGGRVVIGRDNWFDRAFTDVPGELDRTRRAADPGFVDVAALDLHLRPTSPLIGAGLASPVESPFAIPSPLVAPLFFPPPRTLDAGDALAPRVERSAVDLGAFDLGSSGSGACAFGATGGQLPGAGGALLLTLAAASVRRRAGGARGHQRARAPRR